MLRRSTLVAKDNDFASQCLSLLKCAAEFAGRRAPNGKEQGSVNDKVR
jgi:hypothetical protein